MKDQARQSEPIAIIGMACRLPGSASSPSRLWDLLARAQSGHCDIPESRFNANGFFHPENAYPGSVNATGGYFLQEDIKSFDNALFGIKNLEAQYMDPQQRQLLEVVYECLETAGLRLEKLSGAEIGSYVANFTKDFMVMQSKDPEMYHRYSGTGMGNSILANRISHVFNLKGPSVVVDTACSSSLYALHLAYTALDLGECDAAIVAGASLIQSPDTQIQAVKTGMLSSTSTSHTFDVSADGYGRAEGVGAIFIKRHKDALRDRDPIRSIIRGTAVNSNGHTDGITQPSPDGQESVIRKAYIRAGLPLSKTDYIEAHGTGTPVGDPIEVEAISRVLNHESGRPTLIGSLKTNIGHSEAVSGISSILKVVLALENCAIPPTIGVREVNSELRAKERNVEIVRRLQEWPTSESPRASINSFGYDGANGHVILEAGSSFAAKADHELYSQKPNTKNTFLLPFSANDKDSLRSRVSDLESWNLAASRLEDLAYTLGSRRSNLRIRGFVIAHREVPCYGIGRSTFRTLTESQIDPKKPLAFVFTGQGGQWPQIHRQLMEEYSTYCLTIDRLDRDLSELPDPPTWTLRGKAKQKILSII